MISKDDEARRALRARQGAGARHDAAAAPHGDLLLARRGAAYFARKLNELSDGDLDASSLRPGLSRRHLIAHICYQARSLALAVKVLREPLMKDEADWQPDIELAATLPARALRYLYDHSAKHLDVEWRDLGSDSWAATLCTRDGTCMTARDTPAARGADIWKAAIELGNGGRWSDVPSAFRPAEW